MDDFIKRLNNSGLSFNERYAIVASVMFVAQYLTEKIDEQTSTDFIAQYGTNAKDAVLSINETLKRRGLTD